MFKKKDIIIYITVLLLAGAAYLIYAGMHKETGSTVCVTVDGVRIGDYPLTAERKIPVTGRYGGELTLVLSGGKAHVEASSCPDKICVKHSPVSHAGESIICLPNRIVIEIVSEEDAVIDAVSQ